MKGLEKMHWKEGMKGAIWLLILIWPAMSAAESTAKRVDPQGIPAGYRSADTDADLGEHVIQEFVVDEDGDIYRKRTYSGIIPRFQDRVGGGLKAGVVNKKKPVITWVGFQHRSLLSSVFVQTDKDLETFRVYKPDSDHIYVDIPKADVPVRNDRREILTEQFDSPVAKIHARPISIKGFRGTRLIITLNRPTGYMWRQDGRYIYIDIAR